MVQFKWKSVSQNSQGRKLWIIKNSKWQLLNDNCDRIGLKIGIWDVSKSQFWIQLDLESTKCGTLMKLFVFENFKMKSRLKILSAVSKCKSHRSTYPLCPVLSGNRSYDWTSNMSHVILWQQDYITVYLTDGIIMEWFISRTTYILW